MLTPKWQEIEHGDAAYRIKNLFCSYSKYETSLSNDEFQEHKKYSEIKKWSNGKIQKSYASKLWNEFQNPKNIQIFEATESLYRLDGDDILSILKNQKMIKKFTIKNI